MMLYSIKIIGGAYYQGKEDVINRTMSYYFEIANKSIAYNTILL